MKSRLINKIARRSRVVLDKVELALALVALGVLVTLTLMVCLDVLLRALEIGSNAFTSQFSSYALIILAFLPAPWVLRRGQQIDADLLVERLSPEAWRRMQVVVYLLSMVACGVAAYASFQYVNQLGLNDVTDRGFLHVPRWIPLSPMPLSFFLLSIEFAYMSWDRHKAKHDRPADLAAA